MPECLIDWWHFEKVIIEKMLNNFEIIFKSKIKRWWKSAAGIIEKNWAKFASRKEKIRMFNCIHGIGRGGGCPLGELN